jgi:hypothetical protein
MNDEAVLASSGSTRASRGLLTRHAFLCFFFDDACLFITRVITVRTHVVVASKLGEEIKEPSKPPCVRALLSLPFSFLFSRSKHGNTQRQLSDGECELIRRPFRWRSAPQTRSIFF